VLFFFFFSFLGGEGGECSFNLWEGRGLFLPLLFLSGTEKREKKRGKRVPDRRRKKKTPLFSCLTEPVEPGSGEKERGGGV